MPVLLLLFAALLQSAPAEDPDRLCGERENLARAQRAGLGT